MKHLKLISLFAVAVLLLGMLAACGETGGARCAGGYRSPREPLRQPQADRCP